MRVISKKTLRVFWEDPKTPADAQPLLIAWYKVVLVATWHNFPELRQTFNSADQVGDCVVFNVGGNKYRVIGRVRYAKELQPGVVYILRTGGEKPPHPARKASPTSPRKAGARWV